jgi:preprotein translocase subunit SecF
MEFFKIKRDIPFMRHALVLNAISIALFVAAVAFLAIRGLHFSIEFTGGTVMEVAYPQAADVEKIRATVGTLGFSEVQVQKFGTSRDVMIRISPEKGVTSQQQSEKVRASRCAASSSSARRSARSWPPTARSRCCS